MHLPGVLTMATGKHTASSRVGSCAEGKLKFDRTRNAIVYFKIAIVAQQKTSPQMLQKRHNPSCSNPSFTGFVPACPNTEPITLKVIGLFHQRGKLLGHGGNYDYRLGERKIVRDGQINLRGHPFRDEQFKPRSGAARQGHCRFS